jgi:hypothetical protein
MNPKSILLAVDGSQNSLRAAAYVGGIAGGAAGFRIELLAVLAPPDRDIFPGEAAFQAERDRRSRDAGEALARASKFWPRRRSIRPRAYADDVLPGHGRGRVPSLRSDEGGFGTVVVGGGACPRRGVPSGQRLLPGGPSRQGFYRMGGG